VQKGARGQHLDNIEKLGNQAEQIDQTKKVGMETVDATGKILVNMRQQRDKVTGAIHDTREAQQLTQLGKQIVNQMTRREFCFRVMLYFTIFILLCAIIDLVIVKLAGPGSK
jgi:hypothetical protein